MHPILIDLGFLKIPTYGVMIVLAVTLALWTAKRRADRSGLSGDRIVDLGLWLVIWAFLGSKLLLVIVEARTYIAHPAELIGVLRAGGVFLGGLIAAIVAAVVLLKRYDMRFLPTADVLIPSVSLGQSIGRIGCLMAGCCWGARCDLPWAITYTSPTAHANVGTPLGVPLHPFPVYAMIFNFSLYLFLAWLYRRGVRGGRVFATYLVGYGTGRFLLEFTRGDSIRGFVLHGLLSTSQFIAIILVILGVALFVRARRRVAA